MQNFLNEMNRHDREATFLGTYVLATLSDGSVQPFLCDSFFDSRVGGRVLGADSSIDLPIAALDTSMPDLGMIRCSGHTYYVSRRPERQWRRGLRMRGLLCYKLLPDGKVVPLPVEQPFMEALVAKFLGNSPRHSQEGIIDRDLAIVGNLLYFRNIPYGKVENGVVTETFYDELPMLGGLQYA